MNALRRTGRFLIIAVAISTMLGGNAWSQVQKKVPSSANLVVWIDSTMIRSNASADERAALRRALIETDVWSDLSNWQPTGSVFAAELDIQHMAPMWQMMGVEFSQPPKLSELTRNQNGVEDRVMDRDIVWLQKSCAIKTGEKELVFVSPLNRQSAARWIRNSESGGDLSPFLSSVSDSVSANPEEVVFALDLSNVFRVNEIEKAVQSSTLLKALDASKTAKLLAGVQGIELRGRLTGDRKASCRVVFSDSTESIAPIAKPLVIGALKKIGASISDLESWTATASGNEIMLTGSLQTSSIQRLLSLVTFGTSVDENVNTRPEVAAVDPKPAANKEPAQGSAERTAAAMAKRDRESYIRNTKRYFERVVGKLDDIKSQQDQDSLSSAALWINNYASDIDDISTRNVDPDMVEYGRYVSTALKYIVDQFYGGDDKMNSRLEDAKASAIGETTLSMVPLRRRSWGGAWGYRYAPMYSQQLDIGGSLRKQKAIVEEEVTSANGIAESMMTEVDQVTERIRQIMKERYGDDF